MLVYIPGRLPVRRLQVRIRGAHAHPNFRVARHTPKKGVIENPGRTTDAVVAMLNAIETQGLLVDQPSDDYQPVGA
jgi:hypothetical protein